MQIGDIELDEFYQSFWRRKPYVAKGGAASISYRDLTFDDFLGVCDRLENTEQPLIKRYKNGTIHAQNLDRACPVLEAVTRRFAAVWPIQHLWFDGAYSLSGGGIGSHYDVSDNFILQQTGSKAWRLHPPDFISDREKRDRFLGIVPDATMDMPNGAIDIRLDPGDLLYIPILWVHEGTALSESFSLTLAFNYDLPLTLMTKQIGRLLTARKPFWEPLFAPPVGHAPTNQQLDLDEAIDRYLDRLVESLAEPAFQRDLRGLCRQALYDQLLAERRP